MQKAVLVVGYRQGMIKACKDLDIPYFLWTEKPPLGHPADEKLIVAPFSSGKRQLNQALNIIASKIPKAIDTVIPTTEKSVIASALASQKLSVAGIYPLTAWQCSDKLLMKNRLSAFEIPMARYLPFQNHADLGNVSGFLGWPVVAKFRRESGGKGVVVLDTIKQLESYWARGRIFEQYLDYKECSVESFISNGKIHFTNITEYFKKKHINIVPARFPEDTTNRILELNRKVIEALQIKSGMTHLEVYMGAEGPIFGEIAHRPPGGYIMNLIELVYGFSPWKALIHAYLNQSLEINPTPSGYAAAHVIYPGDGTIGNIDHEEWTRIITLSNIAKAKLKVKQGDVLGIRASTGQDAGYVIHKSHSYESLVEDIYKIDANVMGTLNIKPTG